MLSINNLSAQSVGVHGTVKGVKGEPLPGIAIVVKGTSNGVISGANGSYSLSNVPVAGVLTFSSLGYVSLEQPINSRTVIDVVIKEDNKVLDEVVVIGYGVQQKSHLTGSITKVNTDGMADMPVSRLDQALQGKVAGLNVQNVSSEPGTAPKLSIRGMSSISAGSEPLIVVDGYPISGGMEMVNAADVASIEILKDAASAAIYGSRAAGGVIMITTKSGDAGKPSYNFKVSSGLSELDAAAKADKGAMHAAILLERRMEFAFENERYYDMLREGNAYVVNTINAQFTNEPFYLSYSNNAPSTIDESNIMLPIPLNMTKLY